MAVLTFTIEPDEFRGLNAIVELGKEPADGQTAGLLVASADFAHRL